MVAAVWGDLGTHYSGVEVDSYVVMPNHLHGIILLAGDEPGSSPKRSSLSISEVMRRFKSFTTHEYGVGVRQHGWPAYPGKLWQARFYDRIIRNERELVAIRQYIEQNPQRWELDSLNPALRG
jgi:REP element-mobilizing transposase RayT